MHSRDSALQLINDSALRILLSLVSHAMSWPGHQLSHNALLTTPSHTTSLSQTISLTPILGGLGKGKLCPQPTHHPLNPFRKSRRERSYYQQDLYQCLVGSHYIRNGSQEPNMFICMCVAFLEYDWLCLYTGVSLMICFFIVYTKCSALVSSRVK